jgi:hypothetical protein
MAKKSVVADVFKKFDKTAKNLGKAKLKIK